MAASASFYHIDSPSKSISITVLQGHELKGVKGDNPVTYVRVEYNGQILGDSPKVDGSLEGIVKYNFTTTFECSPDGPHMLDDIAHKPLLFTVTEVLPKEKKQKEEKVVNLGQAVADLLPLLQGLCEFKATLPLYPLPGSPLETLRPESKCSIDVLVSVQESLLSPLYLSEGNLLRVTMEAAYSVPEAFGSLGPPYNYMVGLQVPSVNEKECPFLFRNGILKLGGEREPVPRPKKWPVSNILASGGQNIPDAFIVGGPFEEEDGELNTLEDREIRIQGETIKKRVVWDIERRCYLDPLSVVCFRKRIAESRYWLVEITRVPVIASTKGKGGKGEKGGGGGGGAGEEEPISFHGAAYINLVPLLYPGVRRIRGAFRIFPYHDSEVFERTKCLYSLFRDIGHQAAVNKFAGGGMFSPHNKSAVGKKDEKAPKEITRKASTLVKKDTSEITVETALSAYQNFEGQQYIEGGSFLVIEFTLDKALVPKRLPEELASRVREMIPPHPQLPRRTGGAMKAVEDYHTQITSIAAAILDEYHELFGSQVAKGSTIDCQTLEDQKCQLNFELNSSGKYFAFKEQLKHAVVKIVREKYLKTTAFDSLDQLQAFLSELYVYLVDQMHVALNQVLSLQTPSPPPPIYTTLDQLRLFAWEAQVNEEYNLASTYYLERLSRNPQDIQSWLDYGAFCLLTENNLKAQECFREAVALDNSHLPSVLLCGIMAVMLENYEDAEVFFEDATCLDPTSVLAWTMLGLFYDIQENDIQVEMAFHKATKLQKAHLAKEKPAPEGAEGEAQKGVPCEVPQSQSFAGGEEMEMPKLALETELSSSIQPTTSIFMETITFLMEVNAIQFVHRALAHELLSLQGGPSCDYYLVLAQTYLLKKEYDKTKEALEMAIQIDYLNSEVWAQKGHLCYLTKDFSEAKSCYERTISFVTDAKDMHSVYLRLGTIYLENKEYDKAKNVYLQASKRSPSCLTWLGVGIACYRLREMVEAEDALSEANALNNNNAEVWAYLALVCMKGGRQLEAEQSYKYAVKLELDNADLLKEIKMVQSEVGFGDPSF